MTIVDKMMVIMWTIMVLVDLGPFSVDIHSVLKPFCFKIVKSCPSEHVSQRCQHCHRVSERTREDQRERETALVPNTPPAPLLAFHIFLAHS